MGTEDLFHCCQPCPAPLRSLALDVRQGKRRSFKIIFYSPLEEKIYKFTWSLRKKDRSVTSTPMAAFSGIEQGVFGYTG